MIDALQTTVVAVFNEVEPTMSEKLVVKHAGAVARDQYLRLLEGVGEFDGSRARNKLVKGLTKDAAAAVVKAAVPADYAADTAAAVGFLLTSILEGGAKALERMEPSFIARKWIQLVSDGEDPERTIRRSLEMIDRSARTSLLHIDRAISRLSDERGQAYSSAPAAAPSRPPRTLL